MKKYWNVKLTLISDREYADVMSKADAKEMALQDFYDDMRHGCYPSPLVEIVEVGMEKKKRKSKKKDTLKDVIMYDLEMLKSSMDNKKDFEYHYKLLKGNLKDHFKKVK